MREQIKTNKFDHTHISNSDMLSEIINEDLPMCHSHIEEIEMLISVIRDKLYDIEEKIENM